MPTITKSFSFDPDRDSDVARWFERVPDYRGAISEAIIRAIRADIEAQAGRGHKSPELAAIMKKLEDIEAMLGRQPAEAQPTEPDLPEDVLNTLDHLAGLEG